MYHYAFLVACYILGTSYHSGQASKGYRLLCLADQRACREHTGVSIGRTVFQLQTHLLYPKGCDFRNAVAYFLKRLRHQRHSL